MGLLSEYSKIDSQDSKFGKEYGCQVDCWDDDEVFRIQGQFLGIGQHEIGLVIPDFTINHVGCGIMSARLRFESYEAWATNRWYTHTEQCKELRREE